MPKMAKISLFLAENDHCALNWGVEREPFGYKSSQLMGLCVGGGFRPNKRPISTQEAILWPQNGLKWAKLASF